MTHTPFLRVVPQRHQNDCMVACLAMLVGVSYEEALLAFRHPTVMSDGALVRHILAASKRLKRPLRYHRKFDIESDTGVLCVRSSKWPNDHAVVLKDGLVFDTDATIWDVDVYLAAYEARALSLLSLE